MFSVLCLLAILAFVFAVLSYAGKMPLSIAVLLVTLIELLRCLPLR